MAVAVRGMQLQAVCNCGHEVVLNDLLEPVFLFKRGVKKSDWSLRAR